MGFDQFGQAPGPILGVFVQGELEQRLFRPEGRVETAGLHFQHRFEVFQRCARPALTPKQIAGAVDQLGSVVVWFAGHDITMC